VIVLKKTLLLFLTALLCFALTGCNAGSPGNSGTSVPPTEATEPLSDQTWAIYWYLCGSDLESWYGCATEDLEEMLAVPLPKNVQVIIQTGGALDWERDDIQPDRIGRYLYDSEGFSLLEEQPQANMGEAATLASFLEFCSGYPADRTMVLFWNHGGGSVNGAAFDVNYQFDSLTIDEFRTAFEQACTPNHQNPPFDIIGFDACLMATIDVASTFRDIGNYLVASEELEPGNGWYYTDWLQTLANNPGLDGKQLGITICDAYMKGCELAGTAEDITLSVTDLSKIDRLLEAYNALGASALTGIAEDPALFVSYSRGAANAENYGGNTEEEGYTNMVDLGHLARNNTLLLPDSAVEVQKALEACVVYKVNGPYRKEASGLSCFHSYNADVDNFVEYSAVGCSEAFKYLYGYGISGKISGAGLTYLESLGIVKESLPEMTDMLDISALEGMPLYVDEEGYTVLDVLPRGAEPIVNVRSALVTYDLEQDYFRFYGESGRMESDYTEGIFRAPFDGYWPSIDGNFVFTRLIYQGEDYTTYSVPILLNGEEYNLRVVYDHEVQDYTVLGARKGLSDNGMPDKNLTQLCPGDEITTIYLDRSLTGNGNYEHRAGAVITVTEDTTFYEAPLPNGEYGVLFEMADHCNHEVWSDMAFYLMDDYAIYTY
jgi:hypothetical protein